MWNQGVVSAIRTQKQQSMCCGPALLQETYGHYVGGSSKNAPMQPLISFLYFGYWWTKLECEELEKWATVSWALWTARNRFYFEKTRWHPKRILGEALGQLKEYHRLCNSQRQVLHRDMIGVVFFEIKCNWIIYVVWCCMTKDVFYYRVLFHQ